MANEGLINLVSPSHQIHSLPPMHALTMALLDPRPWSIYAFNKNDDLSAKGGGLPKGFLDALAAMAGVCDVDTRRTDDGTVEHFWQWTVTVSVPRLTGGHTEHRGTREIDLRQGSIDATNMSAAQLARARLNAPAMAESKARNRALRSALQIRAMNTREFFKWWVVPVLTPNVDLSTMSQDARDFAGLVGLLGNKAALYGGRPKAPPIPQLPPAPPPAALPSQAAPRGEESENGPLASEDQRRRLSAACDRLGDKAFFDRAALALGYDCPAPAEVTAAEAETILTALNTKAPF